jgi:hypothetical protein
MSNKMTMPARPKIKVGRFVSQVFQNVADALEELAAGAVNAEQLA